jgi:hypothetical protein
MVHVVRRYVNVRTLAEVLVFSSRECRVIAGFGCGNIIRDVRRDDAALMLRRCRALGHPIRKLRRMQ